MKKIMSILFALLGAFCVVSVFHQNLGDMLLDLFGSKRSFASQTTILSVAGVFATLISLLNLPSSRYGWRVSVLGKVLRTLAYVVAGVLSITFAISLIWLLVEHHDYHAWNSGDWYVVNNQFLKWATPIFAIVLFTGVSFIFSTLAALQAERLGKYTI